MVQLAIAAYHVPMGVITVILTLIYVTHAQRDTTLTLVACATSVLATVWSVKPLMNVRNASLDMILQLTAMVIKHVNLYGGSGS